MAMFPESATDPPRRWYAAPSEAESMGESALAGSNVRKKAAENAATRKWGGLMEK